MHVYHMKKARYDTNRTLTGCRRDDQMNADVVTACLKPLATPNHWIADSGNWIDCDALAWLFNINSANTRHVTLQADPAAGSGDAETASTLQPEAQDFRHLRATTWGKRSKGGGTTQRSNDFSNVPDICM